MLRHDLDLLARGDLLQFHEISQQPPDRDRLAGRELRAAALRYLQTDLVGGKETEAASNGIDQRGIVARHDAEMIADAVSHIGRQLYLDMPGRPFRAVDGGLVLQLAICQN